MKRLTVDTLIKFLSKCDPQSHVNIIYNALYNGEHMIIDLVPVSLKESKEFKVDTYDGTGHVDIMCYRL